MNHYKTWILIILVFLISEDLCAELKRNLNSSEISRLTKNIQSNPQNVRSRLFLANHYFQLKNWSQVIGILSPVSEKIPDKSLKQLSHSYLQVGKPREAHALVGTLLSHTPKSTDAFLLAVEIDSEIAQQTSFEPEATEAKERLFKTLKEAQKLQPTEIRLYETWLSMLEKHVSHYAFEALRVMEDMKKNKLSFAAKHHSLFCKYNYLSGYNKETQQACELAAKEDPKNPENRIYLGQSYVNTGEEEKGQRMLASLGEKFSSSAKALHATAQNYHKNQNLSQAYLFYKKAVAHPQGLDESYLGLAQVAFELRKYDVAMNAFKEHCRRTDKLHQEFRRASGLLKDSPEWQSRYRQTMLDCKK